MTEKTYKLTYSRTRGTEKLSNKVIFLKDTKPPKVGVICKTMGFNSITEILIDVIELKKWCNNDIDTKLRGNIIRQKKLESEIEELQFLVEKKINRLANLRYDEREIRTQG